MQNSLPAPHSFGDVFWLAVAIILTSVFGGGGFAVVRLLLYRKKPAAEIHESEARTAKTFAQTRSIELKANIEAGDAVLRMVQQLAFDQLTIEKKNEEIEHLKQENGAYEAQLRRAKAMLKLHNLRWDE